MRQLAFFGTLCALLAWGGCGGTAVVDGESAAGGTGGSGATSTSGGSHQGGTATGTTTGTPTGTGAAGCGPGFCPAEVPAHGASCICEAGLKCAYDLCDESGDQLGATCDGTSWTVENDICGPVYCPNGIPCGENEVCLTIYAGFEVFFDCVENPCPTQPLDCECAESLCDDESYVCTEATAGNVTCECIIC